MDITDYRVSKIENHSFLLEVIDFLKKGFNLSELFEHNFLEYLLSMNQNPNYDPYGYALFKKDKLEGALLTAFQGNYMANNGKELEKIKVINLSGWYVSPESRGLPALFHAKNFIDQTHDSIITGYTFSDLGYKVFQRLGFKKMNAFVYRKFKPNLKNFVFIQTNNIKKITNFQYDDSVLSRKKINSQNDILNFSINLNDARLIFFSGVIKKVKIKSVDVKSFFILWASDYSQIYKSFDNIHKFLLLNYTCISLYFYCPNNLKNQFNISQNFCRNAPFMIRSPLDINYISPIDSELSLGDY